MSKYRGEFSHRIKW